MNVKLLHEWLLPIRYKKQNDRLKELAVRDSLTGLYNHGLLMELLNREVYNQTRENFSLGFFMLDVDHFKSVNDQYGHQAGDFVLKELSGILTATFRLGDSWDATAEKNLRSYCLRWICPLLRC
jgi:two-component system cell cycle response regulator